MKKTFKKLFTFLVAVSFMFTLNVNALTPKEELTQKINDFNNTLNNMKNNNIDDVINDTDYESLKDTKEIENLLNESIKSSSNSADFVTKMNEHIQEAKRINKELVGLKDYELYDSKVKEIEAHVFAANNFLELAKNSGSEGEAKYSEAYAKYVDLKDLLIVKQQEAEKRINEGIKGAEIELAILTKHLNEVSKMESLFENAFDKAEEAYLASKKEADAANKALKDEINKIKEYVNINGEADLNKLIEANTKMLGSGLLYKSSDIAIKLVDYQINKVNEEIKSLKIELIKLEEKVEEFYVVVNEKQANVDKINGELKAIEKELEEYGSATYYQDLITKSTRELAELNEQLNSYDDAKTACDSYLPTLNLAISGRNIPEVVKLLLTNESSLYKGVDIDVSLETILDSSFNLVNNAKVLNKQTGESKLFSYETNSNLTEVSLFEQKFVADKAVNSVENGFSANKYYAIIDGSRYSIGIIRNLIVATNVDNLLDTYNLSFENNKWVARKFMSIKNVKVEVFENGHYAKASNVPVVTSNEAINRCTNVTNGKDEIIKEIANKEAEIIALNLKLEEATKIEARISDKVQELNAAVKELDDAKAAYDNAKASITNAQGLTIDQINEKIKELEKEINYKGGLDDLVTIAEITKNITSGNIDVKSLIEDVTNLNVGLNSKRSLLVLANDLFEKLYENDKKAFEELAGKNYELISDELIVIKDLLKDVATKNIKLAENKAKFEIAKANLNEVRNLKTRIENKIALTNENILKLKELKENNNLDFLKDLEAKLEEANNSLVSVDQEEFVIEIHKFEKPEVIVPDEKPDNGGNGDNTNNGNNNNGNANNGNGNNNNNYYVQAVNANNQLANNEVELEKDVKKKDKKAKEIIKDKGGKKATKKLEDDSFLKNIVNKIKKVESFWILPIIILIILYILFKKDDKKKQ